MPITLRSGPGRPSNAERAARAAAAEAERLRASRSQSEGNLANGSETQVNHQDQMTQVEQSTIRFVSEQDSSPPASVSQPSQSNGISDTEEIRVLYYYVTLLQKSSVASLKCTA